MSENKLANFIKQNFYAEQFQKVCYMLQGAFFDFERLCLLIKIQIQIAF